jgi:acyl-CoA synthetase (NDP forming)
MDIVELKTVESEEDPIGDIAALNSLLKPKSVAVVGASAQPGKIGYTVLDNLIKSGYQGPMYPINPTASEILGIKVYPSVKDIPGSIDAAIITVPAKYVAEVLVDCGKKGVKALIIITSGFSEVGRHDLEDQLIDIARQYGMRILGPNIVSQIPTNSMLPSLPSCPCPAKPPSSLRAVPC